MNKRFLIAILVLLPFSARADDALDAWLVEALEKNPELAAAKQKWEAARQKIPQARSLEDPMIGADVERSGTKKFGTYSDVEWMASQRVPWPGKLIWRTRLARLEAEVVGFQYLERMRATRARVKSAYWDLWLAQKNVEINAENKELLEQFEQIARVRYETGQAEQADVLRAQVELSKLANELVTLERELAVAQTAVNTLLNAPPNTPRRAPTDEELPRVELTLEEMQEQARKYCCILLSFLRGVEAKEVAVSLARQQYAPDFEFRVEARQFNGRSGIQEYDTGVFINFPWLWRGKYNAGVREARAELRMAQADFDNEVNMTMFEIKELHAKTDAAMRTVQLFETSILPQVRQLVESTRAGYQANRATFLELVEAQRALKNAQLEHHRAQADYAKAHAKLEQIIAPFGELEFATGLVSRDMK
jgi:cobalt-zinc-cadmium efflux system outer membrane protein